MSLAFAAFVAVSSLIVLVWMLLDRRKSRVDERVAESANPAGPALPPITDLFQDAAERRLSDAAKRDHLKNRIVRAGLYKPEAAAAFIDRPAGACGGPRRDSDSGQQLHEPAQNLRLHVRRNGGDLRDGRAGAVAGSSAAHRQTRLRRALPDALDVMVVCLEGGLSLQGTLSRVGRELDTAHPLLAHELGIVDREIQLGRSTGDAMRQMAERFDLEELRSLASVISQTERYGAGVVGRAFGLQRDDAAPAAASVPRKWPRRPRSKWFSPRCCASFPACLSCCSARPRFRFTTSSSRFCCTSTFT